jgi:hypothetical protein
MKALLLVVVVATAIVTTMACSRQMAPSTVVQK